MVLATRMTQFWHLVTLWGVVLGLGTGMTALVLSAVVANRWFDTHRGLVMGLLTASSATGQLLFLPVGAWMIEHVGWRLAVIPVFISWPWSPRWRCSACATGRGMSACALWRRPGKPRAPPPVAKMTFATPFRYCAAWPATGLSGSCPAPSLSAA